MTGRARLANDAWESLLTVHAAFMKSFAAAPIWGDVSMKEYDVLYALTKADAPVRITDLHRRVLLSQPALSRMVDRLVERGLVERCEDAGDRRVVRLALTEAGRSRQREVGAAHARDVTTAMTTSVGDPDLEELLRITRTLLGSKEKVS
ncbi:MAG: MarR family transcriptional regulator [Pseudolysinimonas sp.]|uniref:MarR family winged helix-turn-helix transcriptional regulator n=1 Tax=Pseudolysinimonas sp. TaxID=2680009 RepID=UPI003C758A14